MTAFAVLAWAPDLDVLGFALGIPYSDTFGHRGAFHSVAVGIIAGVLFGFIGKLLRQPWLRTTTQACVVGVSHGLLDTLTDGGLGIAVLWPLADVRLFAPLRPIPVAPLWPAAWFTAHGARVLITELVLFLPLLLYALWPRRRGNGETRSEAES